MSNKKTILVILLAAILALLAVLFVFNPTKTTVKKEDVIEEVIEPTAPAIIEEEKIEESTAGEEEEIKPEIKPVAKPAPVKTSTPVIKQIQVEEAKEVVKEEPQNEIQVDAGIIKEYGSNDIVIIREFKSKSPTKYSFEGYGVQKAPIK